VTGEGLYTNVSVGIQYLAAWLRGSGAVAINNLMEDAATAEISRSQIWQWLHHGVISPDELRGTVDRVMAELGSGYEDARALFEQVATGERCAEFLTLPAYDRLTAGEPEAASAVRA
jgi:malate synthase